MLGYMHERDICTVHVVIKATFVFVYEREEGDHALIHAPLCGGSELVRERKRGREREREGGGTMVGVEFLTTLTISLKWVHWMRWMGVEAMETIHDPLLELNFKVLFYHFT